MADKNQNTPELKKLLSKYLANDVTDQKRALIEKWYADLASDNDTERLFTSAYSKNKVRKSIHRFLRRETRSTEKKWIHHPILKYAALILLFIGIGFLIYRRPDKVQESQFFTASGISKTIKLPDGSNIILNAKSRLTVAADFNTTDRKVKLEGEAFFSIAKDRTRPFIIRSGDLKTTVVGTSFNINAYPEQNEIKISVASGKIKVSQIIPQGIDKPLSIGMTKNQLLVFNNLTKSALIKTGDPDLFNSWSRGELYIDNASVIQIGEQIGRHFKMKINLPPGIRADDNYTIRLGKAEMNTSLKILSEITNYNFVTKQNQIYIMGKK